MTNPTLTIGDTFDNSATLYEDDENGVSVPYDASTATNISACIISAEGNIRYCDDVTLSSGASGADWANGVIVYAFTPAITAQIGSFVKAEETAQIETEVTINGNKYTWFADVNLVLGQIGNDQTSSDPFWSFTPPEDRIIEHSGTPTICQDVNADLNYWFDFSEALGPLTISSASIDPDSDLSGLVTITDQGINSVQILDYEVDPYSSYEVGTLLGLSVSGGTSGQRYELVMRLTLNSGDVIDKLVKIEITDD